MKKWWKRQFCCHIYGDIVYEEPMFYGGKIACKTCVKCGEEYKLWREFRLSDGKVMRFPIY